MFEPSRVHRPGCPPIMCKQFSYAVSPTCHGRTHLTQRPVIMYLCRLLAHPRISGSTNGVMTAELTRSTDRSLGGRKYFLCVAYDFAALIS
jgi:hypothetical protein